MGMSDVSILFKAPPIKRYEKTTPEEKAFLGSDEAKRIEEMRKSLITGVYDGVRID